MWNINPEYDTNLEYLKNCTKMVHVNAKDIIHAELKFSSYICSGKEDNKFFLSFCGSSCNNYNNLNKVRSVGNSIFKVLDFVYIVISCSNNFAKYNIAYVKKVRYSSVVSKFYSIISLPLFANYSYKLFDWSDYCNFTFNIYFTTFFGVVDCFCLIILSKKSVLISGIVCILLLLIPKANLGILLVS